MMNHATFERVHNTINKITSEFWLLKDTFSGACSAGNGVFSMGECELFLNNARDRMLW